MTRLERLKLLTKKDRKRYLKKLLLAKLRKAKNGCWVFQGKKGHDGYGEIYVHGNNRKTMLAHRLSYAIFVGKLQKNMCICHKCNNPACCNPNHLYQGTHLDNMKDKVKASRQFISWGEKSGQHKLTSKQVEEIRNSNERQIDLAEKYNVAKSTICMIVNYKSRCYE